jgi:hypothetical protein
MRKILLVLVLLVSVFSFGAANAQGNATVYAVHGIPGVVVDVYVNNSLFLEDFKPGTIAGPVSLAPGHYDVVIVPANGSPATPLLSLSADLSADVNYSLVAHLDASGSPKLSAFVNDVSPTNGKSRLIARHLAAAPAVDVTLNGPNGFNATVPNVTNGAEAVVNLAPGSYSGFISAAGTTTPVFGPTSRSLVADRIYIAYVVGSLSGTFGILVQVI